MGKNQDFSLFSKIKQFGRFDVQGVADIEYHIERDGTIGSFDSAHMGPADVDHLRKLQLGQALFLAVVGNIYRTTFRKTLNYKEF